MKTPNAFALRDFDSERILQRNYFIKRLAREHITTWAETTINDNSVYIESDPDKLDTYDARNVAHMGSAEMVERLARLKKIKSAVSDYKKLLDVHKARLDCLSTHYAKRFAETVAQMWQEKYQRAQNFQQAYSEAITAIYNLLEKITKLEQSGEKAIDQQRRKEFADRLQDTRQKAGLRQSDLALKVRIAPTTISNYEQGRADPQIPLLIRICHALNCSPNKLLGFEK